MGVESADGQMHACTESGGERGPSAGAHARPLRAGCAPAARGHVGAVLGAVGTARNPARSREEYSSLECAVCVV